MNNFIVIRPEDYSWGIWLIWMDNATFLSDIILLQADFIHCLIFDKINMHLRHKVLYGYLHQYLQKQLLKQTSAVNHNNATPRIIVGDLNVLSPLTGKLTKQQGKSTMYVRFSKFIQQM